MRRQGLYFVLLLVFVVPAWSFFHLHCSDADGSKFADRRCSQNPTSEAPWVCYHTLARVGIERQQIELENGSRWSVNIYDQEELKSWENGDALLISPNYSLNNFRFYMTNTRRDTYINVDMIGMMKHPLDNVYTIQAIECSTLGRFHIVTSNHLGERYVWKPDSNDQPYITDWQIDDVVIFGVNDSWFSSWFSSCKAIVYNVMLDEYVRADIVEDR